MTSKPTWIDQWFDRDSRLWITQVKDEEGNELLSSCDGTKGDAAFQERVWFKEFKIDKRYSNQRRKEKSFSLNTR